jgi:hypothetical protein
MKIFFSKLLLKSDLIGYKPCIFIEQNERLRTYTGGIFSIIWYLSILFCSFYFGQELWQKLKPITNSSSQFDEDPGSIDYSKDFEFFFSLTDVDNNNKYLIDNSIYRVIATLNHLEEGSSSLVKTPFKMSPCNNDSFHPDNFELFNKYIFDDAWCIDKNQNISLSGVYGRPGFKMIQINLVRCENTTDSMTCQPNEVINKYLDFAYVSLFVIQNYVKTNDYEQPFKKGISNYYYPISLKSFTDSTLFLRSVEIISDIGLLTDYSKTVMGYTHNNFQTQIILNPGKAFTNVSFELINIKETYFRSYMKFQNLFAIIGGFVNFLKISLKILFNQYYENKYFVNLINKFFESHDNESDNKSDMIKVIKNDKQLHAHINRSDIKLMHLKIPEINKIPEAKILLTGWESFCGIFFVKLVNRKNKKRFKFFELAVKSLKNKLDILSIIRFSFDFAKLRFVTMTSDQNNLFNMLDKINLSSNDDYNNFMRNPNSINNDNFKFNDNRDDLTRKMYNLKFK